MERCDFPFTVNRINSTVNGKYICVLNFFNLSGFHPVSASIKSDENALTGDILLNQGEDIIGLYGIKDYKKLSYFCEIGVMVWKVPT